MKNLLRQIWELFKVGLMLWGAFTALYVIIVIIHNATSVPTPPPGGWYPPDSDDENYELYLQTRNYEKYLKKLEEKQKHRKEGLQEELD